MLENKNILIIEDDEGNRFVLEKFVGQFFNVTAKSDGKNGLAWMVENIPDLVITDLDLPDINGIQFIKNIKSSLILKDMKIIVVSGHNDPDLQSLCAQLGIVKYFVKPFNPAKLVLTLYDVFNLEKNGNKKIMKLIEKY